MNKTSIIMGVIGIVILGLVAWWITKPEQTKAPSNNQTVTPVPTPVVETGPKIITVNFNSKDTSFVAQSTQVKVGTQVVIKVTSDIADEVHLHGYDKFIDLKSGTEGQLTFVADKTGRFEFELEGREKTIGVLEVHP
jgi:hypothetical protein